MTYRNRAITLILSMTLCVSTAPAMTLADQATFDECMSRGGTEDSCAATLFDGADTTTVPSNNPSSNDSSSVTLPAGGSKTGSDSSSSGGTPAGGSKTAGSLIPTNSIIPTGGSSGQSSSGGYSTLANPLKGVNSVSDLILTFMKIVSYLAVIFGVIMLMWVGLQLVLAQGKPEEIKKRTNELLWVVIGIGLIIGARIMVSVIINTLQATGTINPAIIQSTQNAINSQ